MVYEGEVFMVIYYGEIMVIYFIHESEIFSLACEIFNIIYLNIISHIISRSTKLLIFCPYLTLVHKNTVIQNISNLLFMYS